MLARMFIRKVWLLKATPSAGAGAVVQVPTQCRSLGIVISPSSPAASSAGLVFSAILTHRDFVVSPSASAPCPSCFVSASGMLPSTTRTLRQNSAFSVELPLGILDAGLAMDNPRGTLAGPLKEPSREERPQTGGHLM